jgi:hypothetical protein
MTTRIDQIILDDSETQTQNSIEDSTDSSLCDIDIDNLTKIIMDLEENQQKRINAFNLFIQKNNNPDAVSELTSKLFTMFQISNSRVIKNYLLALITISDIPNVIKATIAFNLCDYDIEDVECFDALNMFLVKLQNDNQRIPTPQHVEIIGLLMLCDKYKEESINYFISLINSPHIEIDFRYKSILRIESLELSKERKDENISRACFAFVQNDRNAISYRILGSQYILVKSKFATVEMRSFIENVLLGFAENNDIEYNLRADSADVLLRSGSEENKIKARTIITLLGRLNTTVISIFDNAQNVHTEEIEESVNDIIEVLNQYDLLKVNNEFITFEYVSEKIKDMIKQHKPLEGTDAQVHPQMRSSRSDDESDTPAYPRENIFYNNIISSLNRIKMDRAIYGKFNCSLVSILLKVWTYIIGNTNENEMKQRLLQELNDSTGLCSSGYASRLVNSITGFGELTIKISWRDQIIGNLSGRLNARIRNMDDLALQEAVLVEMTLPTSNFEMRKHFLEFFRENVLFIRDEMYDEFRHFLPDSDFDLYFRSAIANYESGSYN